ncbi:MAG: enoyl-CoA hydratase/isomerase family protein, partial [Alphaproteobacteria bacterium]
MTQMLPAYETILLERRGRLLVVTLNRPDAMNAVNRVLHDELPDALTFAGTDPDSDVVLLTGAGRAFSAGGDIDHMAH